MIPSRWVTVSVNLGRVHQNVQDIRARVGVPILGVVKADAYGLGAAAVAETIRDLVEGWCVFSLEEAIEAGLWARTGKETIVLGPPLRVGCEDYREHRVRPAVSTVEQAKALHAAKPLVCVDTGMQRFACPAEELDAVIKAGKCGEAFTHAVKVKQATRLAELCAGRGMKLHAAASALLDEPRARLDAVRPGMAMYRGAVRVVTRLVEAKPSKGPVGYTEFESRHHGVILCGYSNGLRKGPCLVNGQLRRIMEVGMQSAYVEVGPGDRPGDEVVLLGDQLVPEEVAAGWQATPHAVLATLASVGFRQYVP